MTTSDGDVAGDARKLATVHWVGGPLLSKGLFAAGFAYPAWYLLTPDGATDSWSIYWALALLMVAPEALAWLVPASRPYNRSLCNLVLAALTTWAVWLASVNEMSPFYAVGSIAMGLNCAIALSSRNAFLGFAIYIVLLTSGSFVWDPDPLKLAYWGSLYVMLAFVYWQLRVRLRAEAEVLRYQRDLEHRVEERTRTLVERTRDLVATNDRLERAIADREEAETKLRNWQRLDALSRLAGGVAHDFNNLLTVISGMAEMLQGRLPLDSPERRDTEEICRAAGRAADLTRNLLAFGRQETIELSRIDLNQILRETRPMLEILMGEDVEVVVDVAPAPAWILTNRSQLDQLLVNLALNARDAMLDGGALSLRTRVETGNEGPAVGPGDRSVELMIRDTGVGMDPETSARIFDPFFTTKDVGRGMGLGLATVYGFIEQTSGSISVDSTPGRGTVFSIRWPYCEVPAAEDAAHAHRSAGSREAAVHRKRILVVDDQPSLLRVVRRLLEHGGYEVREASNSQEALRALRDGDRIDLLLTDVVMPGESGIELARQASRLRPELPIVFMSGYLNHPSLRGHELPGGAPLLKKPFPTSALLERLGNVLGDRLPDASEHRREPASRAPDPVGAGPGRWEFL